MIAVGEIADFVRRRTGLVFPESRRALLDRGVEEVMRRRGVTDPALLPARMEADPAILDELVARITVGETYFFRHPEQLDEIRRRVLPALAFGEGERVLRIWSAGCATGEEPYTLAILAHEAGLADRVRILATDLSRTALAAAAGARYRSWALRATPDEIQARCFVRRGDDWEVRPALREMVEFRYLNLVDDTYPSLGSGAWGMDLVVCRNVLIYFDAETARAVARRMLQALGPRGWLVLGASDPPLHDLDGVETTTTGAGLLYRHAGAGSAAAEERRAPVRLAPRAASPPAASPPPEPRSVPRPEPPSPPHAAAAAARTAYAEGDYAGAARLALAALSGNGSDPEVPALLVRALANLGRSREAAERCVEAVARHPDAPELAYLESVLLADAGRFAKAARAARRAVYLDRTYVMGYLAMGAAFSRLGEREAARRAYANAAALLGSRPADAVVHGSDGEMAGRLLVLARTQRELLEDR